MANRKTKLTVGLFVISGLVLAIFAIIWLGMAHIFEDGRLFAAYFDESVQGLQNDSPVKYRGVSIGRVDAINVAPDGNLIEVIMNIEASLKNPDKVIAQLKSVGITGLVFIELELMSSNEPAVTPKLNFSSRYPVIATKTSNVANIIQEVENLMKRVNDFDFIGISNDLKSTVAKIDNAIEEANLIGLAKDLHVTVKKAGEALEPQELHKITNSAVKIRDDIARLAENANQTVSQFQKLISTNETAVNAAIIDFRHSLNTADTLMGEGISLLGTTEDSLGTLQNRMYVTIDHLEQASIDLSHLVDSINRQPSQLLFGKPPTAKKIEE